MDNWHKEVAEELSELGYEHLAHSLDEYAEDYRDYYDDPEDAAAHIIEDFENTTLEED